MKMFFVLILSMLLVGCTTYHDYALPPVMPEQPTDSGSPPSSAAEPSPRYASGEESYYENYVAKRSIAKPSIVRNTKPTTMQKPVPDKPIFNPTTIIDQLRYSAFGYSVPKEANIDDDVEITMIVNPLSSTSEIADNLPDGQKTTGRIEVSRVIQAKLDSNDFIITPITPERQVIIGDRNTIWKWSLSAKEPGPNKVVKITVSAIVLVDGDKTESYIDTYENVININITSKQLLSRWLSANWQWAWGALLIPIAGYFYNKKRKKESS